MSDNGCNCDFCRRDEFGNAYAMLLYSEITEGIKTYMALSHFGIKETTLGDDSLGGYLSAIKCDLDDTIYELFNDEDEESKIYQNQLEQWQLLDKVTFAVSKYNELLKNNTELKKSGDL